MEQFEIRDEKKEKNNFIPVKKIQRKKDRIISAEKENDADNVKKCVF